MLRNHMVVSALWLCVLGAQVTLTKSRVSLTEDEAEEQGAREVAKRVVYSEREVRRKSKSTFPIMSKVKDKLSTDQCSASVLSTFTGPTTQSEKIDQSESRYKEVFNDELWKSQWYMQDYRKSYGPVFDHNIVPAYEMKYTGYGVTVCVVDNGVSDKIPDLKRNLITDMGYDSCTNKPNGNPPKKQTHGNKSAGVIGMEANNGICGVGVAYDADIVGVRHGCFLQTHESAAKALVYRLDKMDIYSCSWGPPDSGSHLEDMSNFQRDAFEKGITQGRNKKGAIYVFPAGNGRKDKDNCASDHIVNHIATIPVGAASNDGKPTWYGEGCSAVFGTTYSYSATTNAVVTTAIDSICTEYYTGTSASTPMAAGMIALALEANPAMTYRDVMHLIAETAEVAPLANNEDTWQQNSRGYWISNDFGFGLFNAKNMVETALKWKTLKWSVPEKHVCEQDLNVCPIEGSKEKKRNGILSCFGIGQSKDWNIFKGKDAVYKFQITGCKGTEREVNFLEHVQVISTIKSRRRGSLFMNLKSPQGYTSQLLIPRERDTKWRGLKGWTSTTVHMWGENPQGEWTLTVGCVIDGCKARVDEATIYFHGTVKKPAHYVTPRKYAAFRLPDGRTSETRPKIIAS